MKNYEKPIVLLNSDLSEGVYTASGDYNVSEGEVGTNYKDYFLSTTNQSAETVYSITFTVSLYGNVTDIVGLKGVTCVRINDTTASVTYTNNSYGIEPGGSVGSIPVKVYGTGDFGISQ